MEARLLDEVRGRVVLPDDAGWDEARRSWNLSVDLARAGLLAGYADQSHLSRETRRLAGLTPRQLTRWQH